MKKCGFVMRVSTEMQAANEEGSLKNQLQRLCAHVEYKNTTGDEQWFEAERYTLKGVSGKDSLRSPEFRRLFEDIKVGRVNTVLCSALDRISRSVVDFLNFFKVLNEYGVEFVCLKQNYDTTSPQGKLFITIMMALAEFERDVTSERTKDATLARAERGLWNGSQVMGYDLDPERKGHIIPNEEERALVNFAFDTYLECGSLWETMRRMNARGYRTKEYTTRRGRFRPAREFTYSTLQHMLSNLTYIGKKEVNKCKKTRNQEKLPASERYRVVEAVWEPIVPESKFSEAQALLRANFASKHNQVAPVKHNYILNFGLLKCGTCGAEMRGTSAKGRMGRRYYYYKCIGKGCGVRIPANEVERVVLDRIRHLATRPELVDKIVQSTNSQLQSELPRLREQREALLKDAGEVRRQAEGITSELLAEAGEDTRRFLLEKLEELGKRRKELEQSVAELEQRIDETEREAVDRELVAGALNRFADVFAEMKPHKQRELLNLLVAAVELKPDLMKIGLYAKPPDMALPAQVQTPVLAGIPVGATRLVSEGCYPLRQAH